MQNTPSEATTSTPPTETVVVRIAATVPMVLSADAEASNFAGKGEAEFSRAGMAVRIKRMTGQYNLEIGWNGVRKLKDDQLLTNGTLSADVGGSRNIPLNIKILEGDRAKVSAITGNAPLASRCDKCPSCTGPVSGGKCQTCNREFRAATRGMAIRDIISGGAIAAVGAAITFATYSAAGKSGGMYLLCYGALASGAAIAVRGIIRLMSASE